MLYELRIYEILPGRHAGDRRALREHTLGFFARHGVEVVGFWHEVVGRSDRLVYLTRCGHGRPRRKWGSFINDPDWQRLRAETEADGQIVARIHNRFLEPTDYSPLP